MALEGIDSMHLQRRASRRQGDLSSQAGGLDATASKGFEATPRRASGRAMPFDLRTEASVPLHSPNGFQDMQRLIDLGGGNLNK